MASVFNDGDFSSPKTVGSKYLNDLLSVDQLGMSLNQKGSPWQKKFQEKVAERDLIIKEKEEQLQKLHSDL